MSETNIFGGKNARSLYVPMSELEQEAVLRLVESKDLRVNLVGWGHVDNPKVTFGDARVQVKFQVHFDRPDVPVPVHFLDLELVTKTGRLLFRARQSTEYAGNPIHVAAGVFFDMVWDIQVRSIDPHLVKDLVPGANGLTSRLVDRDTGEMTREGNMHLSAKDRRILTALRLGEDKVRNSAATRPSKKLRDGGSS